MVLSWQTTIHGVAKELDMTERLILSGFPDGLDCKESACNVWDTGSIPGSGRFPGGGNGYPLQYSCLENSMDRGGWWATVCGVTKSQTWLKQLSKQAFKKINEREGWRDYFGHEWGMLIATPSKLCHGEGPYRGDVTVTWARSGDACQVSCLPPQLNSDLS